MSESDAGTTRRRAAIVVVSALAAAAALGVGAAVPEEHHTPIRDQFRQAYTPGMRDEVLRSDAVVVNPH